jgi:hypothetical protein
VGNVVKAAASKAEQSSQLSALSPQSRNRTQPSYALRSLGLNLELTIFLMDKEFSRVASHSVRDCSRRGGIPQKHGIVVQIVRAVRSAKSSRCCPEAVVKKADLAVYRSEALSIVADVIDVR